MRTGVVQRPKDKILSMDPKEITYEMVQKKLQEIAMARGKTTRIDRQEQVGARRGGAGALLAARGRCAGWLCGAGLWALASARAAYRPALQPASGPLLSRAAAHPPAGPTHPPTCSPHPLCRSRC